MAEIRQTDEFRDWVENLRDKQARYRILVRVERLRQGNPGDHHRLQSAPGVIEMRIHCGPGYRIYYGQQGDAMVLLLAGGDKTTQGADIARAVRLLRQWREIKT